MIIASIITGAIMIYWLGFWPGVIINTVGWGLGVFIARSYLGNRTNRWQDNFRDEKFLLRFILALIGRR
jgi:hypothetical protein